MGPRQYLDALRQLRVARNWSVMMTVSADNVRQHVSVARIGLGT
jgi:hypothetical protein